jgi:hypothetical protein
MQKVEGFLQHHLPHGGAAGGQGLQPGSFVALQNAATQFCLAAHTDGTLVCEDAPTGHHDTTWEYRGPGQLVSCHNKFLGGDLGAGPRAVSTAPIVWNVVQHGADRIALQLNGQYLSARAPDAGGQVAYFSPHVDASSTWIIHHVSQLQGQLNQAEGKVF